MSPAARVLDGGAPPDPGRPVEIQEQTTSGPGRLFDREVPVDPQRLGDGEGGEGAVEMAPAGLHDGHV